MWFPWLENFLQKLGIHTFHIHEGPRRGNVEEKHRISSLLARREDLCWQGTTEYLSLSLSNRHIHPKHKAWATVRGHLYNHERWKNEMPYDLLIGWDMFYILIYSFPESSTHKRMQLKKTCAKGQNTSKWRKHLDKMCTTFRWKDQKIENKI